jgi:hypothetical protein
MPLFNFARDFKTTHNLAVDACASAIFFYRNKKKPLKSIHLTPRYYQLFRHWVSINAGLEEALTKGYKFDDVDIELGTNFQMQPLRFEFWPETVPIAEA